MRYSALAPRRREAGPGGKMTRPGCPRIRARVCLAMALPACLVMAAAGLAQPVRATSAGRRPQRSCRDPSKDRRLASGLSSAACMDLCTGLPGRDAKPEAVRQTQAATRLPRLAALRETIQGRRRSASLAHNPEAAGVPLRTRSTGKPQVLTAPIRRLRSPAGGPLAVLGNLGGRPAGQLGRAKIR